VSGLGHLLEREGFATVLIGLVPQHVQAMKPPRALLVPFELGRPLGEPGNPEAQRAVLSSALQLLDQPGPGPIVESFVAASVTKGVGSTPVEETWACPVSFPAVADEGLSARVQQEISLLMPWFERSVEQRKHTATGVSGMTIEEVATWLTLLLESSESASTSAEQPLAMTFKLAIEDLKAFYLEAATAQPGGSATDLSSWFWRQTAGGELIWSLREVLKGFEGDEQLRIYAAFTSVPEAEVQRRKQLSIE
jgi:hypothetical protein